MVLDSTVLVLFGKKNHININKTQKQNTQLNEQTKHLPSSLMIMRIASYRMYCEMGAATVQVQH